MLPTKFCSGSNKTFAEYLQSEAVYVDKTKFACELGKRRSSIMLHRPHGMGKSLFVSTLKHLFAKGTVGTEGLYCHDHWPEHKCYFVFHLSWSEINASSLESFRQGVNEQLQPYAELFGVSLEERRYIGWNFENLVRQCEKKLADENFLAKHPELTDGDRPLCNKIVLMVDDYDAPLNQNLDNPALFEELKKTVRSFFCTIKGMCLRFVLITGVRGIALCDMFGGANQFHDISLNRRYATSCGYTLEEIEHYFEPQIKHAQEVLNIDHDEFLSKLSYYLDGAIFSNEPDVNVDQNMVFNPAVISSFLNNPEQGFEQPWPKPRLPYSFLVKLMQEAAEKVYWRLFSNAYPDLRNNDQAQSKPLDDLMASMCSITLLDQTYDQSCNGDIKLLLVDIDLLKDKLYSVEEIYCDTAVTLLFQEGYLTIKAIKHENAYLGIANKNVAKLLAAFELNNSSTVGQEE
ncbi:AAA family ATPase [Anaerobiospirillum succiniciproducens]|uniref:AAA family ATPase n=2 Tax=Anaerobiospirillum succiniciproducens TaxID=13335 RepID=UPI003F8BEF24